MRASIRLGEVMELGEEGSVCNRKDDRCEYCNNNM
jgi:hypothetical protein